MVCPICDSTPPAATALQICALCGYDFSSLEINDWDKAERYVRSASRWVEGVLREYRVHKVQIEKRGSKGKNPGRQDNEHWSERDTAQKLNINHTTVAQDLRLAEKIKLYPELRECEKNGETRRKLKQIESKGLPISELTLGFTSEQQLQRHLEMHWDETDLGKDWVLVHKGEYRTGEVGDMDLLARHKNQRRWLVVELKPKSTDVALGQVLRYMGWVRINCAAIDESVEGLIISDMIEELLLYAMICTQGVNLMRFELCEGELILYPVKIAHNKEEWLKGELYREIEGMTKEESNELIAELKL